MSTSPGANSRPPRPTKADLLKRTQAATGPGASRTICARCGNRPASRRSPPYCENCANELGTLWREDEIRQEMLALVYAELSKDPAVRADLDALVERVRPLVKDHAAKKYAIKDPAVRADLDALLELVRPLVKDHAVKKYAFMPASPPPGARKVIAEFVAKWHLPNSLGVIDVWGCVVNGASGHLRGGDILNGVMLRPVRRGIDLTASRRASDPVHQFVITPHAPEPFLFDPTTISRREVNRRSVQMATEMQKDILRQADQIIAAWRGAFPGWRPMPPRYRKSREMERIARRVSRAMLGWSAARIARAERPAASADAVRKTLREWLPKLQIEVPARRTPARGLATAE